MDCSNGISGMPYLAYLYMRALDRGTIQVLGSVGDRTGLVIDGTQIDAGG